MDEIKKLLDKSGLSSIKDAGLTIVSLYGVSENKPAASITIANRVVGHKAFSAQNETLQRGTIELADGLQLHVDDKSKTVYIFIDSQLDASNLSAEKSISNSIMNHESASMRGLLFMLTVSHLVIPILPPSVLPADFLSTLVTLNQIKSNMHTHLVQYQSSCWKHWNINVPYALFEKKEMERTSISGWWGPAKGVPILVFIAIDIPFEAIVPASIKRMQESLQTKTKNIFRALQLIPLKPEGSNALNPLIEVKSLFLLPSGSQPIVHIVPSAPVEVLEIKRKSAFTFQPPASLSSLLNNTEAAPNTLYHEYGGKLLKNFVSIWSKTATTRHPLHARKGEKIILPSATQFISAVIPLLYFFYLKPVNENNVDLKKAIAQDFPSTKGMAQQIEVILRKKIRDTIEIERVFSKSHSMSLMEKCTEAYLQDSPPFYTEQYHTWKKNNVMRMYKSLARGPCMEEFAIRLEKECHSVWKQGKQSCEHVSLTGRPCRLKIGHENEITQQKSSRDDRTIAVDTSKHNSGFNFFHACNCGRTQRMRDDPFDLEEANIKFYNKFGCCLGTDRAALDIEQSVFGEQQKLVLNTDEIPPHEAALIYLGPASIYKNNVGLDKVDGFMNNTNFLIPWSMTTVDEVKLRQQQKLEKPVTKQLLRDDTTEWPMLGKNMPTSAQPTPAAAPVVASLEAFPALGTVSTTPTPPVKQLFDTRRRRHHRMRERVQGLVRGYIGAEYECPHGHRFLSCGEGRICKLGHTGHPKEHGNYFVHQDLPIFVICPCTYANGTATTEVTAQLFRLYVVSPDEAVTISLEPKIKLNMPGEEEPYIVNLDISESLSLGKSSAYVMRLPFVYQDKNGSPIPIDTDAQKRLKSATLLKDCIKFHYKETKRWQIAM